MSAFEETHHAHLARFLAKYEINPKYGDVLHDRLVEYQTVIVADDSASMASLANPDDSDNNPHVTRWYELKIALKIVLEAHALYDQSVDVYFVNRGSVRNVRTMAEIEEYLALPPSGASNLVQTLQLVEQTYWQAPQETADKKFVLHILTDGHPTTNAAQEDIPTFEHWLLHRLHPERVCVSLLLCTDDVHTEHVFRLLAHAASASASASDHTHSSPRFANIAHLSQRLRSRFHHHNSSSSTDDNNNNSSSNNNNNSSHGEHSAAHNEGNVPTTPHHHPHHNVDVLLDYRGEVLEVWRTHGRAFPFNYGDYVVKLLVGSVNAQVHEADMARAQRISEVSLSDLPPHPLLAATTEVDPAVSNKSCVIM